MGSNWFNISNRIKGLRCKYGGVGCKYVKGFYEKLYINVINYPLFVNYM